MSKKWLIQIIAFDTNVVDLTEKSRDPVDLLYGFQLGGGTEINKSVAYCEQFIETPIKSLVFHALPVPHRNSHSCSRQH